jgi:ferric-dicitrate binding protein FerR (iron transport regulator)
MDAGHNDSIEQAALAWVMALHEAPGDTTLLIALADWLNASPQHRRAYEEANRVWVLTGLIPPA